MMDISRTPLLTDLYELTMLQTYYEHGMEGRAVFEFFARDPGPSRPFLLAAGLEQALEWLQNLEFTAEECQWVRDCGHFSPAFAARLNDFHFTGEVRAMPEGTVFFPEEPILQVIAPLPEAQLVESRLMNILHFQSLIATKAARCRVAAGDRMLVDFGLRRAHGGEAGLWAARASYIAGFNATATCLANAFYGVPVAGTMAHSFILAHESEEEAFERFARSHPHNVILLIDTFDTEAAAEKVVALAPGLARDGIRVRGVRIDSGDLADHARRVRRILDDGGLQETTIFASGGLDEYGIRELVADGAPIDGFGVGSKVDTSADLAFLDSAYKLHQYEGEALSKRSEGKADLPGMKQVFRFRDGEGRMSGDTLGTDAEALDARPLLKTVMRNGRRLGPAESMDTIRARVEAELNDLPEQYRTLETQARYPVDLSSGLRRLKAGD
ncbi:MAG: nicotinate phosphoribosyltransferase [Ectothiorhodospiraceae bacterium]|jgi:nicotinate phosphoribosyltransferase